MRHCSSPLACADRPAPSSSFLITNRNDSTTPPGRQVDTNLLTTFNIGLVVRGSRSETSRQGPVEPYRWVLTSQHHPPHPTRPPFPLEPTHPPPKTHQTPPPPRYALPKSRRMFRELSSPSDTTTRHIIARIVANREAFEARNAKKAVSEEKYYQSKDGKGAPAFVQEV